MLFCTITVAMLDIGTLGGSSSSASAINNSGTVIGQSDTPGYRHAFSYSNGIMSDIGTLKGYYQSAALGINTAGDIVGDAYTYGNDQRAFLYTNNKMLDLTSLVQFNNGWNLQYATSINDNGWIIGYGIYNKQQHAFFVASRTGAFVLVRFWHWHMRSGISASSKNKHVSTLNTLLCDEVFRPIYNAWSLNGHIWPNTVCAQFLLASLSAPVCRIVWLCGCRHDRQYTAPFPSCSRAPDSW